MIFKLCGTDVDSKGGSRVYEVYLEIEEEGEDEFDELPVIWLKCYIKDLVCSS